MVVDDHDSFRMAAAAVIAGLDLFEFAGQAASGEEALQVASWVRPDLVLMDMHLPGMDGAEAARHLVRLLPDTVIVICSSYREEDLPPGIIGASTGYLDKALLTPDALRRAWQQATAPKA